MAEAEAKDPGFFLRIAKGMNRPGEFMAMWREFLKDLQTTFSQAVWGQPSHSSEPNTPLNPTMQVVTAEYLGKPLKPGEKAMNNETAKVLDMPEPTKELSIEELRGYAKEKAQLAVQKMEKGQQHGNDQERGGLER